MSTPSDTERSLAEQAGAISWLVGAAIIICGVVLIALALGFSLGMLHEMFEYAKHHVFK